MTSIVLITNGTRPRLLEQTLRTLCGNTPADQYTLTVVSDGPNHVVSSLVFSHPYKVGLFIKDECKIVGALKNAGVVQSEKQFGRGEWLLFVDDDLAFLPGWLWKMQKALNEWNRLRILGGVRHPYHGVNLGHGICSDEGDYEWQETDAIAGYCHFMRWSTWDAFGPYDSHAKGTGQSEDFALCRKVVEAGGKVGYIHPPVMAHCGITNSEGKPILGGELIERIEGVLYL